jgi:hypothetical protein
LNWKTLTIVCAAGLIIGMTARAALSPPPPSRVEHIVELFQKICLPHHSGSITAPPKSLGLVQRNLWYGEDLWIDAISSSSVSLTSRECEISTYAPFALDLEQGKRLATEIENIVAQKFPMLTLDPNAEIQVDDVFKIWMQGARGSKERWGVVLFVYSRPNEAGSSLTLSRRPAVEA